MNRTRAYYREMREKHIKRKKRISNHYWYYKFDGQYSKGKIHCSCPICASKTNTRNLHTVGSVRNWKHSDLIKLEAMNNDLKEFEKL